MVLARESAEFDLLADPQEIAGHNTSSAKGDRGIDSAQSTTIIVLFLGTSLEQTGRVRVPVRDEFKIRKISFRKA